MNQLAPALDFWENNQLVSIVIICAVILVLAFFIILLAKILPKNMTQEEKEEKESQKEDQKAMDLFASSTSIFKILPEYSDSISLNIFIASIIHII